jgi:hypothetical protein
MAGPALCLAVWKLPEGQPSLTFALGGFTHMKIITHVGMRKIVTGWSVFISGSLLLVWLHTFRDSAGARKLRITNTSWERTPSW